MAGSILPGILGLNSTAATPTQAGTISNSSLPGSVGTDSQPLSVKRIIASVTKDWNPPNPDTTPTVTLTGKTLADVAKELNKLGEWGKGGGSIRNDAIPAGNSTDLDVKLHGNLVKRLPKWNGYQAASPAAQKEWDKMIVKLTAHEQRHMDIAIEEADALATDLIGKEILELAALVTKANRTIQKRQQELDNDTESGSKPGVPYGDVFLDETIL